MTITSQPLTENLTQADFEAMWAESWEDLGVVDPNIVVEPSPPQEEPFTGLYHTHYREYDVSTGRWLSEDPKGEAGAGGPNLYVYCLNDPLNLIDKSGGEVSVEEYENLLVMGANLGSALKRSEAAGKDNNPIGAYLNLMLADYIYEMMKSNFKESWASVESGPSLNRLAHESLGGAILDVIPRKFYGPVDATKRAMLRAQGIPANHHTLAGLPINTISSHSTQMLPIELHGLGGKVAVSALRRAFMRMLTSQAGKSAATAVGGFAVTKISGSFFKELGSRLNPLNYRLGFEGFGAMGRKPTLAFLNRTNIALGLRRVDGEDTLLNFASRVGAASDTEWAKLGLHNAPTGRFDIAFQQSLDAAVNTGGRIKFNLQSLNVSKALGGDPLTRVGRYTEWELQQIVRNKTWFNATDFYDGTKLLSSEEVKKLGIFLVK